MNGTIPTPTFAAVDRSTAVWRLGLIGALSATLGVTAVLSLGFGRFDVPPSTVVDILLSRVVGIEPYWNRSAELVVLNVRGPRIVAAMLVGAALAVAGAAYQSLFRNPLAAPDILGVSAGAGFGASLGIILGLAHGCSKESQRIRAKRCERMLDASSSPSATTQNRASVRCFSLRFAAVDHQHVTLVGRIHGASPRRLKSAFVMASRA